MTHGVETMWSWRANDPIHVQHSAGCSLQLFLYVFFTRPVTHFHHAFVKDSALPDDQARDEDMLGLRLGISGQFSTVY